MVGGAVTLTRIAADKGHIIGQSALKHELMEVPMRRLLFRIVEGSKNRAGGSALGGR
jgi:hypothetical protein